MFVVLLAVAVSGADQGIGAEPGRFTVSVGNELMSILLTAYEHGNCRANAKC